MYEKKFFHCSEINGTRAKENENEDGDEGEGEEEEQVFSEFRS